MRNQLRENAHREGVTDEQRFETLLEELKLEVQRQDAKAIGRPDVGDLRVGEVITQLRFYLDEAQTLWTRHPDEKASIEELFVMFGILARTIRNYSRDFSVEGISERRYSGEYSQPIVQNSINHKRF